MSADDGLRLLGEAANRLAKTMLATVIETLAHALGAPGVANGTLDMGRVVSGIAQPHYRSLALGFLNNWRSCASEVSAHAVAAALMAAAVAEVVHREQQSIEIVWTGPETQEMPVRRTEQVLLQVIESATRRVLVVSYAVYNIPRIAEALIRAAERGVSLSVIVETPDPQSGRDAYNSLRALGPSVASRSSVYLWPHYRRPKDQNGRLGILKVKCVVADGRWLFLSSANLTEYAFTLNMELGLLVTGGKSPGQVEHHFDRLIALRELTQVQSANS
jgi:phosphatidylserine/phosphatidylglycerophosphate/cardiolipin synthase-like enzyme